MSFQLTCHMDKDFLDLPPNLICVQLFSSKMFGKCLIGYASYFTFNLILLVISINFVQKCSSSSASFTY